MRLAGGAGGQRGPLLHGRPVLARRLRARALVCARVCHATLPGPATAARALHQGVLAVPCPGEVPMLPSLAALLAMCALPQSKARKTACTATVGPVWLEYAK